jgi:hypothetical protein
VPHFIITVTYFRLRTAADAAILTGEEDAALMPRHSPFPIRLTREERRELEARARKYTLPYRDVLRAKLVLLAARGLSNDVIAARLDTPRQIISKWRHRFFDQRLAGLDEEPRSGRPARRPRHPRR